MWPEMIQAHLFGLKLLPKEDSFWCRFLKIHSRFLKMLWRPGIQAIEFYPKSIKMHFIMEILYLINVLSLNVDGFPCTKYGH